MRYFTVYEPRQAPAHHFVFSEDRKAHPAVKYRMIGPGVSITSTPGVWHQIRELPFIEFEATLQHAPESDAQITYWPETAVWRLASQGAPHEEDPADRRLELYRELYEVLDGP